MGNICVCSNVSATMFPSFCFQRVCVNRITWSSWQGYRSSRLSRLIYVPSPRVTQSIDLQCQFSFLFCLFILHGSSIFIFYTEIFLQEEKRKEKVDNTHYQVKRYTTLRNITNSFQFPHVTAVCIRISHESRLYKASDWSVTSLI